MRDKVLAVFIGEPVLIKEVQINHSYALVFTPSEEGVDDINDASFHSLLRTPSLDEMQAEILWQPDGQSIVFLTMLYIDEHVWQFRSMVNDNIITIDRTTYSVVGDTMPSPLN